MQVLLFCHHDDWDRKETFSVSLALENLPAEGPVLLTHYRIDRDHSNACAEWERQDRPDWPDEQQRAAILARSGPELLEPPEEAAVRGGRLDLRFTIPTHAVSLLTVRPIQKKRSQSFQNLL